MIGKITLENGTAAEMGDDGIWRSKNGFLADYLNLRFAPLDYDSPTCMPFGVLAVAAAAFELNAQVEGIKAGSSDDG